MAQAVELGEAEQPAPPLKAGSADSPRVRLARSDSLPLVLEHNHADECPVCIDLLADAVSVQRLPCGHEFCGACVERMLRHYGAPSGKLIAYALLSESAGARMLASRTCKCPLCRTPFDMAAFVHVTDEDMAAAQEQLERRRERAAQLAAIMASMPPPPDEPYFLGTPHYSYGVYQTESPMAQRPSLIERAKSFLMGRARPHGERARPPLPQRPVVVQRVRRSASVDDIPQQTSMDRLRW